MNVMRKSPYYAAIDLGSNSCRLIIAKRENDQMVTVDAFSRIVRLSEGVSKNGYISEPAIERVLAVLSHCASKVRRYAPLKLRCVATEVCRQASNTAAFLERVRQETDFHFTVISQEEEASLAVRGIQPLLDPSYPYALVFDVGGGSTEGVLVKQNSQGGAPEIIDWMSLPIGVVSIAETQSPEKATSYLRITASIREALEHFGARHDLNELIAKNQVQLVGSSGTATTAAAFHLGLRYYDRSRIDGLRLSFEDIEAVIKEIQMMTLEERALHPCIGPERCDLVLGGMAIFEGLAAAWPIGHVTVADRGVRDGLILKLSEEPLSQDLQAEAI